MADVKAIPDAYSGVSPYLCVDGCSEAIDFYGSVLGATERMRLTGSDGRIGHAEIQIGDSVVMLADEFPERGVRGPRELGGTPVTLSVYVQNVDDTWKRAIDQGAKELRGPKDQFYGDRTAQFEDPFGHRWSIASRIEDVSEAEIERRFAEAMSGS